MRDHVVLCLIMATVREVQESLQGVEMGHAVLKLEGVSLTSIGTRMIFCNSAEERTFHTLVMICYEPNLCLKNFIVLKKKMI